LLAAAVVAFALPAFAEDPAPVVPIPHLAPLKPVVPATDLGGMARDANAPADSNVADPTIAEDTSGDVTAPVDDASVSPDNAPASDGPDAGFVTGDDMEDTAPPPAVAVTPPDVGPPSDIRPGSYTLEARLEAKAAPLGDGVKWRIFGDTPGTDGRLPLLGEANGGIIYLRLDPGTYYVHAAYGRAGATRKVDVTGPTGGDVLVLNAGGVRLLAMNGKDQPLAASDVSFDIYAPDEGGSDQRFLLIQNAPPGHVISLNAGIYHVVSKYGDANAVVRSDIKVEPGKLTEATVFQKAARLTLKLVEQRGGEALADTAWSVVTPDGLSIVESVGAFPSVVLAAGDYTAKAKHEGKTYQLNFTVTPGANRDVEVLTE
jgi:hypothetical protein